MTAHLIATKVARSATAKGAHQATIAFLLVVRICWSISLGAGGTSAIRLLTVRVLLRGVGALLGELVRWCLARVLLLCWRTVGALLVVLIIRRGALAVLKAALRRRTVAGILLWWLLVMLLSTVVRAALLRWWVLLLLIVALVVALLRGRPAVAWLAGSGGPVLLRRVLLILLVVLVVGVRHDGGWCETR